MNTFPDKHARSRPGSRSTRPAAKQAHLCEASAMPMGPVCERAHTEDGMQQQASKHFTQQTRQTLPASCPPPSTSTWSSRDIHPRAHRESPPAARREREQHRLSKQ